MTLLEIQARLENAHARETQALRDMNIALQRDETAAHERALQAFERAQDEIDVLEQAERAAQLKEE